VLFVLCSGSRHRFGTLSLPTSTGTLRKTTADPSFRSGMTIVVCNEALNCDYPGWQSRQNTQAAPAASPPSLEPGRVRMSGDSPTIHPVRLSVASTWSVRTLIAHLIHVEHQHWRKRCHTRLGCWILITGIDLIPGSAISYGSPASAPYLAGSFEQ
jgi:hypothetical protein